MCQTFAKTLKFLSAILIVLLLLLSFIFSGCGCTDQKSPSSPPQNNEESANPEDNNGNSNNSPEDNNQNNEENIDPPTTNPPGENENQDSSADNEENWNGNNNQGNNSEENDSPSQNTPPENLSPETPPQTPPTENEGENETPEQPSTPIDNFSLEIKTFENIYGYSFEKDCFFVDFSSTNALYFEIKLLNNEEIVENVNFNICLSDNSFGIFDSVIYNSVYIELQKVGEFEITISANNNTFSKTFKVVVGLGE